MKKGRIGKENVGKIAERIVANELEYRGFRVRDLNLEGLAKNVDLLAVKNERLWQIQVKGSSYNPEWRDNSWWFQYGYCTEEHIRNPEAKMFNRTTGAGSFCADVVVLVCVRAPNEYKCIVLPAKIAEDAAKINLDYAFRAKREGKPKYKPNKVYFAYYKTKARTPERQAGIDAELKLVTPYENKWDFDNPAPLSTVSSESVGS